MSHDARMVDLSPDPRVLKMLGEINFEPWQCVAELVDNSVDAFLSGEHSGTPSIGAEVTVSLPEDANRGAQVLVRDNGPGMSVEGLSKAVRAGWSGNDPLRNLGLFGMGFNIATARLGSVTEVFTSRVEDREEIGLRIDLDALHRQGDFSTQLITRPKIRASSSGTSVRITKLKTEYLGWFASAANRDSLVERLGQVYSSMLRPGGHPRHLFVKVNGDDCRPYEHCVWSEQRGVDRPRLGRVSTRAQVARIFDDRPFCAACWRWLPPGTSRCDVCRTSTSVSMRPRQVAGWLGIQRYPHTSEYGIDFIRNGRKIEVGNKELFDWQPPDGASAEPEYPIDDPRQGGRIVGEIHLDHCRVTYTKDRFERNDPAWAEMVRVVRGDGPLRPQAARKAGFSPNDSPLYRLYQVYRRSDPHGRRYADVCAIHMTTKHRTAVKRLLEKFRNGSDVVDDDSEWWALVEASDAPSPDPAPPGPGSTVPGFGTGPSGPPSSSPTGTPSPSPGTPPPASVPQRVRSVGLSRTYEVPGGYPGVVVEAYEANDADPVFGGEDIPWASVRSGTGAVTFCFRPNHDVFQSSTLTPLDALLCEIARRVADIISSKSGPQGSGAGSTTADPLQAAFAMVLSALRLRYCSGQDLRQAALRERVAKVFTRALLRAGAVLSEAEQRNLHDSLEEGERDQFREECYKLSLDPDNFAFVEGQFFTCVPLGTFVRFVQESPEMFFDGRVWTTPYAALDDSNPAAVRRRQFVRESHQALLLDLLALHEDAGPPGAFVSDTLFPRARRMRVSAAAEALSATLSDGTP